MTTSLSLADSARPRPHMPSRVIIGLWVALITVMVASDHIRMRHSDIEDHASSRRADALEKAIAGMSTDLEGIRRQPPSATQASFASEHQAVAERLARLERELTDHAALNSELVAMQDRLNTLEARMSNTRAAACRPDNHIPHLVAAAPTKPDVQQPPFALLGVELRGGQQFVAISPPGTHSLSEIRLLHVGDAQDGWQLEKVDSNGAEFLIEGRKQRVELP